MHAIIFKSEQDISEIPVSWKLGIDITCENAGDTAKVIHGGPTCTFQGKQIPCISCCGSIKFFWLACEEKQEWAARTTLLWAEILMSSTTSSRNSMYLKRCCCWCPSFSLWPPWSSCSYCCLMNVTSITTSRSSLCHVAVLWLVDDAADVIIILLEK